MTNGFLQHPYLSVDFLSGRAQEPAASSTHDWIVEHQLLLHHAFENATKRMETTAEQPKKR